MGEAPADPKNPASSAASLAAPAASEAAEPTAAARRRIPGRALRPASAAATRHRAARTAYAGGSATVCTGEGMEAARAGEGGRH